MTFDMQAVLKMCTNIGQDALTLLGLVCFSLGFAVCVALANRVVLQWLRKEAR